MNSAAEKLRFSLFAVAVSSCHRPPPESTVVHPSPADPSDRRVAVLNSLRNTVNQTYGFKDGKPRVNSGPCGRFAKTFREQWNARFRDPVNIVFVMTDELTGCYHVLVKLPDGQYFDGGNGVITGPALL